MLVNFQENPSQLRRAIANLGVDVSDIEAHGLTLLYASPVELQIDSIVTEVFRRIATGDARRLVIDALGDLESAASDPRRVHDYVYSLTQHFAVRGVTTLLTIEAELQFVNQLAAIQRYSYMSDNIVRLGWSREDADHRELRVVKMRGSAHEHAPRELEITAEGLRVK